MYCTVLSSFNGVVYRSEVCISGRVSHIHRGRRGITSKARDNMVSRVQHNQSSSMRFASRDLSSSSVTTRHVLASFANDSPFIILNA